MVCWSGSNQHSFGFKSKALTSMPWLPPTHYAISQCTHSITSMFQTFLFYVCFYFQPFHQTQSTVHRKCTDKLWFSSGLFLLPDAFSCHPPQVPERSPALCGQRRPSTGWCCWFTATGGGALTPLSSSRRAPWAKLGRTRAQSRDGDLSRAPRPDAGQTLGPPPQVLSWHDLPWPWMESCV